jgi:hypothetical protein
MWYTFGMARTASKRGSTAAIIASSAPLGRPVKYKEEMSRYAFEYLSGGKVDENGDLQVDSVGFKPRTIAALAVRLGVNESTLYEWRKNIPEFAKAIKMGKAISEEIILERLIGSIGSTAGTIFYLKNAFGYADKIETHTTVSMTDRIAEHDTRGERVDWDRKPEIIDMRETEEGKLSKREWSSDTS